MDPKIIELTRMDPRYTYEAYDFVRDAVSFTQERLGRIADAESEPAETCHVSGGELLRGACALAAREFGMMAPIVFKMWGIHCTDDFGKMVFNLISVDQLSKSDRDDPDDFHKVFDLEQVLAEEFEMSLADASSRRGER